MAPLLVALLALGGLALLSGKSRAASGSPSPPSPADTGSSEIRTVQTKAGETWKVTLLFTGVTTDQARAMMSKYGSMMAPAVVLSWQLDPHSNTVTALQKYNSDDEIRVNSSESDGTRSVRITDAVRTAAPMRSPAPPVASPPPPPPPPPPAWSPTSSSMMMMHGQRYEVQGPGSASPSDWAATFPLTIEGKDVSALSSWFRFIWNGPSGTAKFPGWATASTEIRPWVAT